jgi:hypothetical protein
MGWSSGSRLFGDIIDAVRPVVKDEAAREELYTKLIPAFEDQDWDTQDECLGMDPAYDAAIKKLHGLRRLATRIYRRGF